MAKICLFYTFHYVDKRGKPSSSFGFFFLLDDRNSRRTIRIWREAFYLNGCVFASNSQTATCFYDAQHNNYYVKQGKLVDGVGVGEFFDESHETGWGRLYVTTSESYEEEVQTYCAGYLEGYLTSSQISLWYTSWRVNELKNASLPSAMKDFLSAQSKYSRSNAEKKKKVDPLWHQVSLIMSQFDGLVYGYQQAQKYSSSLPYISELDMYALTSDGDLETLEQIFPIKGYPKRPRFSSSQRKADNNNNNNSEYDDDKEHYPKMLDCSAFVKVSPDGSDLFAGHTTWTHYYSMYRIFKYFHLALKSSVSQRVAYSSRPAFLSSKDDFYMADSGLVSFETTNGVDNQTLLNLVQPDSLFTWQRVIIANRLASNGQQWTNYFAQYNSGTYNNQWMVVDYNQFTPHRPIQPNTLWILEQVPGTTISADVSDHLKTTSYWPSYNVPYFANIYQISNSYGNSSTCLTDGQCYDYTHDPRAYIFNQLQSSVDDIESFRSVLQYNDYQHNPYSKGSAANAISSRYDLTPRLIAFGGIDSKVVSATTFKSFECQIISGPTHQQQTPFSWTSSFPDFHDGQPQTWNFDWITFSPNSL